MGDILTALPQLSALIEKGGVIGLLLIVAGVLGSEVWRLRKDKDVLRAELEKAHGQRDRFRIGFAVCKAECDRAGIKLDLSLLTDMESTP